MSERPASRPLSPHLQIYSWGLHMALSIIHRMTGAALGLGTLLLAWWLMAIAAGPSQYAIFRSVALHPLGRLVLFGFTFALVFHLLNGLRHLVWDLGRGLGTRDVRRSGVAVVALSLLLTVAVWVGAYYMAGRLGF